MAQAQKPLAIAERILAKAVDLNEFYQLIHGNMEPADFDDLYRAVDPDFDKIRQGRETGEESYHHQLAFFHLGFAAAVKMLQGKL